jgi:putative flippase GtrA
MTSPEAREGAPSPENPGGPLLGKLLRFGLVGGTVMLAFMALNALFGLWLGPQAAFLAAYGPAVLLHFCLNKWWTFRDRQPVDGRQVRAYLAASVITFCIQWPVFTLVQSGFGAPGWLAAGVANGTQMVVSFVLLQWRVFRARRSPPTAPAETRWFRSPFEALGVGAVAVVVVGFYAWTALPQGRLWELGAHNDYYHSQVEGWLRGQLHLTYEPASELLALADPYDPEQNAPYRVHDTSLYNGKYHIYFGLTPAVTLFAPVRLLTGQHVSHAQATFGFCAGAFLLWVGLLLAARRRYFPTAGMVAMVAAVVAVGLLTMVPAMLRRPAVWEVPIAAAYFWSTVAFAALWATLHGSGRHRLLWLASASTAYGLAVGARPTYAFGAAVLLIPVGLTLYRDGWKASRSLLLGAVLPITAVVAGLLVLNWLRFDHPLEFGQTYQLSGAGERDQVHFGLHYWWYNFRVYGFAPAQVTPYFPYIDTASLPLAPGGHLGVENPYGVVPNLPTVLFAFALPWLWWSARQLAFTSWTLALIGVTLIVGNTIFLFGGTTNRYMVDFLPPLVALAALSFFVVPQRASARRLWRVGQGIVLLWSTVFAVLVSISHNQLFKINQPNQYRRLAELGNWPSHLWDRLSGTIYGPLELDVVFPQDRLGTLEPLLTSGGGFKRDYLWVYYPDPEHVILGYEHTSYGGPKSSPIRIEPGKVQRLVIDGGWMYPPETHPYFRDWPVWFKEARTRWLRVELNGQTAIQAPAGFYDPVERGPRIGVSPEVHPPFGPKFNGSIRGARRLPPAPAAAAPSTGPVRLVVEFPVGRWGASEPLVSTGRTGQGDVISVTYLDEHHVRFGHDHWGGVMAMSDAIPLDYGRPHEMLIEFGPFDLETSEEPTRLRIWLNAALVMDLERPNHSVSQETIRLVENRIGASTAGERFTGQIFVAERLGRKESVDGSGAGLPE